MPVRLSAPAADYFSQPHIPWRHSLSENAISLSFQADEIRDLWPHMIATVRNKRTNRHIQPHQPALNAKQNLKLLAQQIKRMSASAGAARATLFLQHFHNVRRCDSHRNHFFGCLIRNRQSKFVFNFHHQFNSIQSHVIPPVREILVQIRIEFAFIRVLFAPFVAKKSSMVMPARAVHVAMAQFIGSRLAHVDDRHIKMQGHARQRMIRIHLHRLGICPDDRHHPRALRGIGLELHAGGDFHSRRKPAARNRLHQGRVALPVAPVPAALSHR